MTSRQRNYPTNIPTRLTNRQEKLRKTPTYHLTSPPVSPKLDHAQDLLQEARYAEAHNYTAAEGPTEDEYKGSDDGGSSNDSYDTNLNVDENEDDEYYRDVPEMKPRERLLQDMPCPQYASNRRSGSPYNNIDAYDDITRNSSLQRRSMDYVERKAYDPTSDPHSITTVHKMQQLQELQRRRDLAERYYSQEIKRLIGDQYLESKAHNPSRQDKMYPQSYGERAASRSLDNLERCGTMTTVTRLNCGCVERTTKPIFTTPHGRVERRSCPQDQHTKITGHNSRLIVANSHHQPRLKSKSFGAAGTTMKNADDLRQEQQRLTSPVSRSNSPTRKISESLV